MKLTFLLVFRGCFLFFRSPSLRVCVFGRLSYGTGQKRQIFARWLPTLSFPEFAALLFTAVSTPVSSGNGKKKPPDHLMTQSCHVPRPTTPHTPNTAPGPAPFPDIVQLRDSVGTPRETTVAPPARKRSLPQSMLSGKAMSMPGRRREQQRR